MADDEPVLRFFSDGKDVSRDASISTNVVHVTGTVHSLVEQDYATLDSGTPVLYPRQASLFKTSSLEVYRAVRYQNYRQRRQLDRALLNDVTESWTQKKAVGSSQAFVGMPLSASMHEVQALGYYRSGSQAISSAVPYTSSLYYEKPRDLRKAVWKLTASLGQGGYATSLGQLIHQSASTVAPHIISISAPAGADEGGRIVDVKLWIEMVQVSGNNALPPLGQFGIALRNPNLSWGHAHPIRNYSKDGTGYGPFETPSEFYRDTFLLWEPSSLYRDGSKSYYAYSTGSTDFSTLDDPSTFSPVWDRDMAMRTIFCDGAQTRNPRDIYQVYKGEFAGVRQSGRAFSAPNFGSNPLGSIASHTASMFGNGWPWYDDPDISASYNAGYTGAPPPGWLNGPGGTFAENEWPTSGSNFGPHFIRGVYPMLDDIYVRKLYQFTTFSLSDEVPDRTITPKQYWEDWIGFRPGLRGKEMGTRWELLIAQSITGSGLLSPTSTYFRQARLEFTYEVTPNTRRADIRPPRIPRRSGVVPLKPGLNLVSVISGSKDFVSTTAGNAVNSAPDYFISGIYVMSGYELEANRAIGITYDIDLFYANRMAVYTASVAIATNTASFDRAQIAEVLSPSALFTPPQTLSAYIRTKGVSDTTETVARTKLSGTL